MSNLNNSKLAKAGLSMLKRLVFDERTVEADNRRTEDRTSVAGEVDVTILNELQAPVGAARVFIRDVSKNGCGLWSRVHVPPGHMVLISFPPIDGNPATQRLGKVCHCRGQAASGFAIGVRFTDAAAKSA